MSQPRILIVEDEAIIAADIETRLKKLGYPASESCASGEKALTLAEQWRPNLVLMDIKLQGDMDGITAARQIKERWQLPVVFLTAYSEDATFQRAKMTDPFGYILKPFDDRELKSVIEIALYKHQAQVETQNLLALSERSRLAMLNALEEQKQTEKALQESEARFRSCFELPLIGVAITSPEKGWLEVNTGVCAMLGYSAQELTGMTWAALTHPDDLHADVTQFNRVLAGEINAYALEKRFIRKDGNVIWTNLSVGCVRKPEGSVKYIVALLRDITEHKRKEEEARVAATQISYLTKYANDFIFLLDDEFRILETNERAEDFYGYSKKDLVGMYASQMRAPDAKGAFSEQVKPARTTGKTIIETVHQQKNGTKFPVEISLRSFDIEGKRFYQAIIRDITERKKSEDERTRLIENLRSSNADLEQFAVIASHDLQEPLRMVIGFVDLLKQRYKNKIDRETDEYINFIVDAVTRMQALIAALLRLAHAGIQHGNPVLIDAGSALNDALKNINKSILESKATISIDQLPGVWYERAELCQVFQNLIGNALKFRREAPLSIHIGAKELEHEWEFSVGDNGIGFNHEDAKRIFAPFQRLHGRQYPGNGIGLALCKKIIERHGGHIRVKSTPDHGSVFSFTVLKNLSAGPDKKKQLTL